MRRAEAISAATARSQTLAGSLAAVTSAGMFTEEVPPLGRRLQMRFVDTCPGLRTQQVLSLC